MGFGALGECSCGAEQQTVDHILASYPLYHPPKGHLIWRLLKMTLWTGFKEQHSASDDIISIQTKTKNFVHFEYLFVSYALNTGIVRAFSLPKITGLISKQQPWPSLQICPFPSP